MTVLRRPHASSLQLPPHQTLMAIQLNEQTMVTYLAMIPLYDWLKRIPLYVESLEWQGYCHEDYRQKVKSSF